MDFHQTLAQTTRRDSRRSILVNGAAYRREMNRKAEPTVTLPQAVLSGVCVACFAVGVLLIAVGLS